jgi:hypothetical protein
MSCSDRRYFEQNDDRRYRLRRPQPGEDATLIVAKRIKAGAHTKLLRPPLGPLATAVLGQPLASVSDQEAEQVFAEAAPVTPRRRFGWNAVSMMPGHRAPARQPEPETDVPNLDDDTVAELDTVIRAA